MKSRFLLAAASLLLCSCSTVRHTDKRYPAALDKVAPDNSVQSILGKWQGHNATMMKSDAITMAPSIGTRMRYELDFKQGGVGTVRCEFIISQSDGATGVFEVSGNLKWTKSGNGTWMVTFPEKLQNRKLTKMGDGKDFGAAMFLGGNYSMRPTQAKAHKGMLLVKFRKGIFLGEALALLRPTDARAAQQRAEADALSGIVWRWNFSESELRSFRDSEKTALQTQLVGAAVGYGIGFATFGASNMGLAPYGEHLTRGLRTKYASHVNLSKSKFARQEDYLDACTKAAKKTAETLTKERGKLEKDLAALKQKQAAGTDVVKSLRAKLEDISRETRQATEEIRFHTAVVEAERKSASASQVHGLQEQIARIRGEKTALEKLAGRAK